MGPLFRVRTEPVFNSQCMELIRDLQDAGAIWAINTGRSVDLLEKGLAEFALPIRPDFILTTERDVFRPGQNGEKWEPFGDWNQRCARDHADLFSSAGSVLAEFVDFATNQTKARLIYNSEGLEGLAAESEEEMDHITRFHSSKPVRAIQSWITNAMGFTSVSVTLIITKARRWLSWRVYWMSRAKTFSRRAITTTMCRCWTEDSQRCRPVRRMPFRKCKLP